VTGIPVVSGLIGLTAGLTLEIYLVQDKIRILPWVRQLAFPFNIVLFSVLTWGAAYMLQRMACLVSKTFAGLFRRYTAFRMGASSAL